MNEYDLKLCKYDQTFLDLSYNWLKDEEIKYLTDAGNQTKDSQLKWYKSIQDRTDYLIWGVMYNNNPIGVCGIKNINNGLGEYFGYIGDKTMWGKGLGKLMMMEVEFYVLQNSFIHILFLKVLKDNQRAISLYLKLGYKLIGEDERFLLMNKIIRK